MAALYWFMTIITDQFENKLKILIKEEGIVHFEKKNVRINTGYKNTKKKQFQTLLARKNPKTRESRS